VQVDVRVVAATNRELTAEIAAGRFREDLYYRLNVLPIQTPALREHLEDLAELVSYFVRRFAEANNYPHKMITEGALSALRSRPWRGNVRELRNVVERLLILSPGEAIGERDVVTILGGGEDGLAEDLMSAKTLREFREAAERLFLLRRLEENDWNVTRTAQEVDTPRSNLYKKMDQYGIKRQESDDA
jgi:two-component system nitrogen regulation response regulator NtrX